MIDDIQVAKVREYICGFGGMDDTIVDLLMLSVGRILLKRGNFVIPTGPLFDADNIYLTDIVHVRDWLKVAVADKARWLQNVDELGRPKKLLKFGNLGAVVEEANRQMERKQTRTAKVSPLVSGEEVVFDAGDGWTIVRMLSEEALDRESEMMRHCVGHGSYDWALEDDDVRLLSLRDPRGFPHVTMEVKGRDLVQFKGKQNGFPVERYFLLCRDFLRQEKITSRVDGVVTDVGGTLHSIYNLPDTLVVSGSLNLSNGTGVEVRLPRRIVVDGNLIMGGGVFSNAPEHLEVTGSLYVYDGVCHAVPASLSVGGSIMLQGFAALELPVDLRVNGKLDVSDCSIERLPEGLYVRDALDVSWTSLSELPKTLRCGAIDISYTRIKRFDTAVFHSDDAGGDSMMRSLVARSSSLEEIVGEPRFTSLDITGSGVQKLPSNLVVTELLDVSRSPVRCVPADARLSGSVVASGCEIDILVSEVGCDLTLKSSRVGKMAETLTCGGFFLVEDSEIGTLPEKLACARFRLSGEGSTDLPREIVARNAVELTASGVTRIESVIRTDGLSIGIGVVHIGEGVDADQVTVNAGLDRYVVSATDLRDHLSLAGDLSRMPDTATRVPFPGVVMGMTGSGKSTVLDRALRDIYNRRGPNVISFEAPIEFPELSASARRLLPQQENGEAA